jgi:Uma2 family endonuclease
MKERPPTLEVYDRRETPRTVSTRTPVRSKEPRVVLNCISWKDYERIGDVLRDRPNLRLTYDQETLEIMTTSPPHEILKRQVARIVEIIAEELETDLVPIGSMTFQQQGKRGFEPDECYWITNAARAREMEKFDPEAHPPPDLLIEIEFSRSALPRMSLFAALKVPEVWRYSHGRLTIHRLKRNGTYRTSTKSAAFPQIDPRRIPWLVEQCKELTFQQGTRLVRKWVQTQSGRADDD